jgi:hypothetical protein
MQRNHVIRGRLKATELEPCKELKMEFTNSK